MLGLVITAAATSQCSEDGPAGNSSTTSGGASASQGGGSGDGGSAIGGAGAGGTIAGSGGIAVDGGSEIDVSDASDPLAKPDGAPPEADWLFDPEIWEPLPGGPPECEVHRARLPSGKIPQRSWSSCGDGCLVSPAPLPGTGPTNARQNVVATPIDGIIHYRISHLRPFMELELPHIVELGRLDGEQVGLLRFSKSTNCDPFGGHDTPYLLAYYGKAPDELISVAAINPKPPISVAWANPPFAIPPWTAPDFFDIDDGWGMLIDPVIEVGLVQGSSERIAIVNSGGPRTSVAGRGERVVWADWSGYPEYARVGHWSQASGVEFIPKTTCNAAVVALSDERVVWLCANGSNPLDGYWNEARFYSAAHVASGAPTSVVEGPGVPNIDNATYPIITYGEYAAVKNGYSDMAGAVHVDLIVANLITGKVWAIPSRSGNWWGWPMAMNDVEIIVQEMEMNASSIDNLVRLDLSKLDLLAAVGGP